MLSPSRQRRSLHHVTFALIVACALPAAADATSLDGVVLHVKRAGSVRVTVAAADRSVTSLRGTAALLASVSRGSRVHIDVDGARVRRVQRLGTVRTTSFRALAVREDGVLMLRATPYFAVRAKTGDVTAGDTAQRVGAPSAPVTVTWTLASSGAITATGVVAGFDTPPVPATPAPATPATPAPTSTPAPAPTSTPAPAPTSTPAPAPTSTPAPAPTTAPSPASAYAIGDLTRRQVYHSPQHPGYTAWAGAWLSPDRTTVNTSFVQVTGPVTAHNVVSAPVWTGVDLRQLILSSSDGGQSFATLRSESFAGVPHAYSGQAMTALADGTLVRNVNGEDLQAAHAPVRGTAYLQFLRPGATSWTAPEYLMDPDQYTYQVSRVQAISGGRLIATGNYWDVPAGTRSGKLPDNRMGWLLMVSDDQGATWKQALTEPRSGSVPPNEWDVAELPSGDLLAMMRTYDRQNGNEQVRRQAVLRRTGAGWAMETPKVTPFAHSGHPELLATREGVILNIATTGIDWTSDAGKTWHDLATKPSGYYPNAVQAADGTIYVFSHKGADDDYGERDQAILLDRFRLEGLN